jgi:SAM-dependent methyltransferase
MDPVYNQEYYQKSNYHNYDGLFYRFYHLVRYLYLGIIYRYFFRSVSVLDIGCATGMSVFVFRKVLGLQAFGLDISTYATQNCLPAVKKYIRCHDIQRSVPRLPLKHFDLVVSFDTLEHISPASLNNTIRHIFSLTDRAIFDIYTTDEPIAKIHRYLGINHPDHLSEHPSGWWLDYFRSRRFAVSRIPFARPGSLLVKKMV